MDDKIIIPEYGNVMSTVPGSSGVSFDLKESPTSQQLVRLKVLRGCSGTQWVKDESGAQSVEIIRPPKSPWDQLPTVCLYEGVFENGIVKGKVYKIQNSAAVPNVIGNDGEGTSVMQYQDFENNEDIATEDNLIGTFEMSRMPK